MFEDLRKHPRVPADLSCELSCANGARKWPSRMRTLAREGVGLRMSDPDVVELEAGDEVAVTMMVFGASVRMQGRVVWVQAERHAPMHIGVHFEPADGDGREAFRRWVERAYETHRRRSEVLAAELAWRREVSLRELQDALDRQARDGGFLTDVLLVGRGEGSENE